ncbi:MAG: hypothetical protein ABSG15_15365, partial [FCB group bacterium]
MSFNEILGFFAHMSFNEMLGHLAQLIYVLALVVKRMIWLRIIMNIGCIVDIIYSYKVGPETFRVTLVWCTLTLIVNFYWLFFLIKERINLKFNDDEDKLHKTVFYNFADVEFNKLMRIAKWNTASHGTVLIEQNTHIDSLLLLFSGSAVV